MTLVFWRICRKARAKTAFDGEGARLFPGRWNHKNVPLVYCASSLSLATLEYFVHVDPADLPGDLVAIRAELPTRARTKAKRLAIKDLPREWREYPGPDALKDLGSAWVNAGTSAALIVPSAITPNEENILLNPKHPDLADLRQQSPEPFAFDPRMRK